MGKHILSISLVLMLVALGGCGNEPLQKCARRENRHTLVLSQLEQMRVAADDAIRPGLDCASQKFVIARSDAISRVTSSAVI